MVTTMYDSVTITALPHILKSNPNAIQEVATDAIERFRKWGYYPRVTYSGHTMHIEVSSHDIPQLQDTIDRLDKIAKEMGVPLATLLKAVAEDTQDRINEFRKD